MRILLATPLIDGRADREFISGLISSNGLYAGWACLEGCSNISCARDALAAQFLAGDCDRLVFIDGDIGFSRDDLARLSRAPVSLVSGLYPAKTRDLPWTFRPEPGVAVSEAGLVPVRDVPCGFLGIDRRVLDDLAASGLCPSYDYRGKAQRHFFQSGVSEGEFLSEDYFFSALARRVGHRPYIDPEIRLRHVGRYVYQRTAAEPPRE
jgi:hypothetical protein